MRPGTTFSHHNPTSSPSPFPLPDGLALHSAWRSPVPYLFGGLAAMLGLIALALLTLACTYWRLTGYLNATGANNRDNNANNSTHGMGKGTDIGEANMAPPVTEHVAVIMAGEAEPTYLATPVQKKYVDDDSSNNICCCNCSSNNERTTIVADLEVGLDLERGMGATIGDPNQGHVELNQQQLRRQ